MKEETKKTTKAIVKKFVPKPKATKKTVADKAVHSEPPVAETPAPDKAITARKVPIKVYKVTIMGNDYFAYGQTKQGAINVVFDAIKGSGVADLASGRELFDYGKDGGIILGDSVEEPTYQLTIEGLDTLAQVDPQSVAPFGSDFVNSIEGADINEDDIPEAVAG